MRGPLRLSHNPPMKQATLSTATEMVNVTVTWVTDQPNSFDKGMRNTLHA